MTDHWSKSILRIVQKEQFNRYAFVVHPLDISFIHSHPRFTWTRFLPDWLVEEIAAHVPPLYLSRIRGGRSMASGQRIEGYLLSLGGTPLQMMKRDPHFTYRRLLQAARMAERKGARIMGLGAYTSVVGDAGCSVAAQAGIAITTGNSLTVAVALETAKQAIQKMSLSCLSCCRVMIFGAGGSIGSGCARMLARETSDLVLVSNNIEKLARLQDELAADQPGATIVISTPNEAGLGELQRTCDLIITATSAVGQRVVDLAHCKPGAVICDVARPLDISQAEAALRPDVLVVESGDILIPGEIDFGYNIGLPPESAYACLGETALLAMEGRFENFTIGRKIIPDQVDEIFRLFKKHGFRLDELRSFGKQVSAQNLAEVRAAAERRLK